MQLTEKLLNQLTDIACDAARAAGAWIRNYTASEVEVMLKEGGDSLATQVVTEVDESSQKVILEFLRITMQAYDLGLLTEELNDDGSRFSKDYFWCVDPLDGTLPFTQGKAGYAVSIALVRRDGQPMIGVVYDPVEDRLYRAAYGLGLTINDKPWSRKPLEDSSPSDLRFCMDCTFDTDPQREVMTERLYSLARKMGYAEALVEVRGGAVCNACYVLEHSPAMYVKEPKPQLGGGCSWDFAATACIFQEAGGVVTDYHGKALELNSAEYTYFNHCGVCFSSDPELAQMRERTLL